MAWRRGSLQQVTTRQDEPELEVGASIRASLKNELFNLAYLRGLAHITFSESIPDINDPPTLSGCRCGTFLLWTLFCSDCSSARLVVQISYVH